MVLIVHNLIKMLIDHCQVLYRPCGRYLPGSVAQDSKADLTNAHLPNFISLQYEDPETIQSTLLY